MDVYRFSPYGGSLQERKAPEAIQARMQADSLRYGRLQTDSGR